MKQPRLPKPETYKFLTQPNILILYSKSKPKQNLSYFPKKSQPLSPFEKTDN